MEVNSALNSLFTAKRASELERQSAIRDFETSLHQCEVDTMAAIDKAKAACSRRELHARVKCTKAIMKVKLDYHMTIQEARTAWCAELQESEVAYSEALGEAAAKKSHECTTLRQMHVEHMWDLEAQAIRAENRKLPGLPPSASNSSPSSFAFSQRGVILFLFPFIGAIFSISATCPLHPSIPAQSEPIFGCFYSHLCQTED